MNAAYVCWQLWLNLLIVCTVWALQLLTPSLSSSATSPLLSSPFTRALADHSLLFFLASNLCTGAVNVTVDTLHTPPATALAILLLYIHLTVALTAAYAAARRPRPTRAAVSDGREM